MALGIRGISDVAEAGRSPAATTYTATDEATGRRVVVKVLHREATPEVRARFDYDQARLVELGDHPNIVRVLRSGYTDEERPYVVTELVDGPSLAAKVGAGLDGPGVLALGIRIAGALESAHRRDVVHGDLRPEDVRIDGDGEPEVADFGIAMVTGVGPDRATDAQRLAHAAPEQLQTHVPTPASDVYALGSVLYALLAGGPAFVRPGETSIAAVGARILHEPPPELRGTGVPDAVVDAIERAMQKDPAARWSSAEAFGLALQQAEVTLGLPISPMSVVGPDRAVPRPQVDGGDEDADAATESAAAPAPKRRPVALLAGLALLLVAAAVAGVLVLGGGDDEPEDPRTPVTRPEAPDVELVEETNDDGTITVGRIEAWDDVDGSPAADADGNQLPDIVAATDVQAFFGGDVTTSGIEVTVFDGVDDAEALLQARIDDRGLADECTTDLPPTDEELAGFAGVLERFEGCSGGELVVFAGVSGGRGIVVEAHLVDDDDREAIDAVLESIRIR